MSLSAIGRAVGGPAGLTSLVAPNRPTSGHGPFERVLLQYLAQANQQQAVMDQAVIDLAVGRTEDVHQVMLAVAKADLAFRTVLEIRNRLTDAYQEIIRMQV